MLTFCAIQTQAQEKSSYAVDYQARLDPDSGLAQVTITLSGERLPSKLTLHLNPERHKNILSSQPLKKQGNNIIWTPQGERAQVSYQFVIDSKKSSGKYDSYITDTWAVFRGDKLIPPISVKAPKNLGSRASLELTLPDGWRALTPYANLAPNKFQPVDPKRNFVRPKGWIIAGKIGSRQEIIDGIDTVIAAPKGQHVRRQDALAFLNWNLPHLKKVFPKFPQKILIVMAGEPMWRGGLSGPRSLFMHADRPLISGNRTSSLLHELVHVAMAGVHKDNESDWIVEGMAEYYSLQTLRRSGGISEQRYQQALKNLANWGQEAPSLLVSHSSGPITARAVGVLNNIDQEIRKARGNKASLDDVAKELAETGGELSLARFTKIVNQVAGKKLEILDRKNLTQKKP